MPGVQSLALILSAAAGVPQTSSAAAAWSASTQGGWCIASISRDAAGTATTAAIRFNRLDTGGMLVLLPAAGGEIPAEGLAEITPAGGTALRSRFQAGRGSDGASVVHMRLGEADVLQLARAGRFSVALSRRVRPEFSTAGLTRALAATPACQRATVATWELGTDEAAVAQHPRLHNIGRFFGRESYPPAALREGAAGKVEVALRIDAAGRVERCRIIAGSGNTALDEGTCAIFREKVTADPGRTATGEAIPAAAATTVTWFQSY